MNRWLLQPNFQIVRLGALLAFLNSLHVKSLLLRERPGANLLGSVLAALRTGVGKGKIKAPPAGEQPYRCG
jgi:hypothetical protein